MPLENENGGVHNRDHQDAQNRIAIVVISPKILKHLQRITVGDRFKKHKIRAVKVIETLGKQSKSQKQQKGTRELAQTGLNVASDGKHQRDCEQKDMYREAV